jgi:hypothetical protein
VTSTVADDVTALEHGFAAIAADARSIVDGLDEARGTWRPAPDSWSVAECFDHLAIGARLYVQAMEPSARQAAERGSRRTRPVQPGLFGGWFARSLEPPVKTRIKMRAPRAIRPRPSPPLASAYADFVKAHEDLAAFMQRYRDIELASVRFPNPFIKGLRFSLATGLHVLAAHDRRHLWQARNVLDAAKREQHV